MHSRNSTTIDISTFHKLWNGLPEASVDKAFWTSLEEFCDVFLSCNECIFTDKEFFSVPHTGRLEQDEIHIIDSTLTRKVNEMRALYDIFTLWNPLAISSLLKINLNTVIEQFLLAVEREWLSLQFIICCESCACDIVHRDAVSKYQFTGTYHVTNAFRCPVCSDRVEVSELKNVQVFFQLNRLPSCYQRLHHRQCLTELAKERRLETFFCPAGAGFAFRAHLPRGQYLFAAPFMETFIELDVETSAESVGSWEHYLSRIIDLNEYSQPERTRKFKQQEQQQQQQQQQQQMEELQGQEQESSEPNSSRQWQQQQQQQYRVSLSNAQRRRSLSRRPVNGGSMQRRSNLWNGSSSHSSAFGGVELEQLPSPPILKLKHGKVLFRIYNNSVHSGYLDLFVAFDTRAEFSAVDYPELLHVPIFMHHIPRGLRSPILKRCTPRPPSTTRTTGVYVRHIFELGILEYIDPAIISVLQEVHRYSLEDHEGLLIGVSSGGTSFESSFLTLTSALASSICFTQRVLVRLGEKVVLGLRCSITEGPLMMAAYQGQYNDADNMRSSYPDVQFVGAVIYASQHPPIAPPYLVSYEENVGCDNVNGHEVNVHDSEVSSIFAHNNEMGSFTTQESLDEIKRRSSRSSIIMFHNNISSNVTNYNNNKNINNNNDNNNNIFNSENNSFVTSARNNIFICNANFMKLGEKNKLGLPNEKCTLQETPTTRIRFELRSVAYDKMGEIDLSKGAVCLREDYLKGVYEDMFPYFLNFLQEHFTGTYVVNEPHALVVTMPLPVIYANVQMSTILDKSCYKRKKDGVFY